MQSPHYLATAAVVAVALSCAAQQGMDVLSRSAHIVSIKAVDRGATEAQ